MMLSYTYYLHMEVYRMPRKEWNERLMKSSYMVQLKHRSMQLFIRAGATGASSY